MMTDIEFMRVYNAATPKLRELSTSTIYSFSDLHAIKRGYNLTDFGVEEVINYACPRGISIFVVASHVR